VILTNKHNLPAEIFEYLQMDFYDHENAKDTLSATTFYKPIQEIVLLKRYFDIIEVDALDQMWSLFGSGVHAVLEKIKSGEPIKRLFHTLDGQKISGKYDRIADDIIKDYKCTKAWSISFKISRNDFSDWRLQLSIYRWLYWKNTGTMLKDTGDIIAILRDWDERDLGKKNYPEFPVVIVQLKLLGVDELEEFLLGKIRAIRAAESAGDQYLPQCSVDERWWNERQKLFLKCEKYCTVRSICPQHAGSDIFGNVSGAVYGRKSGAGKITPDGGGV
jgi:hypothetical protein